MDSTSDSIPSVAMAAKKKSSAMDDCDVEYLTSYTNQRFPFCVVWTPIPLLSWIFPFLGHTGIASSNGKIRDFAGPYYVAEDNFAFGNPCKIWRLDLGKVKGGVRAYDYAVTEASLEYGGRIHNIFWDNCHSHVGKALNIMEYDGCKNWNMGRVALFIFLNGKYVDIKAWLKTNVPFISFICLTCIFVYLYSGS